MSASILASVVDNALGLGLAVAAVVFLVLALLYPERF